MICLPCCVTSGAHLYTPAPPLPIRIFVFDASYTNVALQKPATSSTLQSSFTAAMGVDGIIDYDNYVGTTPVGNLVSSSACDGSAWWQVDLGGIYNISAIMVFNNEPQAACPEAAGYTNSGNMCTMAQQLAGAQLQLLNFAGNGVIFNITLSGIGIQTIFSPATYAPTPSATPPSTPSSSSTSTAASTKTSTSSASITASSSASNSAGSTPTVTSSQTPSSSLTASSTLTASNTPSQSASPTQTQTPPSVEPLVARITTSGTGQCLNFIEVRG